MSRINVYECDRLIGSLVLASSEMWLLERDYIEVALWEPIPESPFFDRLITPDSVADASTVTFKVGYERDARGLERKALQVIHFPAETRDRLGGWRPARGQVHSA